MLQRKRLTPNLIFFKFYNLQFFFSNYLLKFSFFQKKEPIVIKRSEKIQEMRESLYRPQSYQKLRELLEEVFLLFHFL